MMIIVEYNGRVARAKLGRIISRKFPLNCFSLIVNEHIFGIEGGGKRKG
jgi:hypothetical protein